MVLRSTWPTATTWSRATQSLVRGRSTVADRWQPTLVATGEPERLEGDRVSADYFRVLGVNPSVGRTFEAADDVGGAPQVAIVTASFATRRFGSLAAALDRHDLARRRKLHRCRRHARGFENRVEPSRRSLGAATVSCRRAVPKRGVGASPADDRSAAAAASRSSRRERDIGAIASSPTADFPRAPVALLDARDGPCVAAGVGHRRRASGAAGDLGRGAAPARDRVRQRREHPARACARAAQRARAAGGARRRARPPRAAAIRGERARGGRRRRARHRRRGDREPRAWSCSRRHRCRASTRLVSTRACWRLRSARRRSSRSSSASCRRFVPASSARTSGLATGARVTSPGLLLLRSVFGRRASGDRDRAARGRRVVAAQRRAAARRSGRLRCDARRRRCRSWRAAAVVAERGAIRASTGARSTRCAPCPASRAAGFTSQCRSRGDNDRYGVGFEAPAAPDPADAPAARFAMPLRRVGSRRSDTAQRGRLLGAGTCPSAPACSSASRLPRAVSADRDPSAQQFKMGPDSGPGTAVANGRRRRRRRETDVAGFRVA